LRRGGFVPSKSSVWFRTEAKARGWSDDRKEIEANPVGFNQLLHRNNLETLRADTDERQGQLKTGAFALVAAAILGVGTFMWTRSAWTRAENVAAGAQIVRMVRRDIGDVVKATGIIKPRVGAEVRVGSRISGVVKRLYVRIGDRVDKGQLLAELDDRDLIARRDEASASLQQAEVNFAYATTDLQRKQQLSAEGILARTDLDVAERAAAVAEKQVTAARASLAYATTQLAYARIEAPIAGVVASVSTQEGETVAASFAAPTFVTLVDLSRLEVWAYVDETDIGRIRVRQHARFTVDTYGDHQFEGRVTTVYPKAEIRDNVVNYVAVVRFDAPRDRTLRPEMTTTVRIALDIYGNVLALPIRAVRRDGEATYVLTRRGATIERRLVTTGSRDDSYWEIVDGVSEGDEVLIGAATEEGVIDDRAAGNQ
jgi:HlyD family secretion protein